MQTQQQRVVNLQNAAASAVACEAATGLPAEITVAQWALESGWGVHSPGNNCFGIKSFAGCSGIQTLETSEFINGVMQHVPREFATFATLEDCFQKHARLITEGRPYRKVWQQYQNSRSLDGLIQGIGPIYATAPNYAQTIIGLTMLPRIVHAIAAARVLDKAA